MQKFQLTGLLWEFARYKFAINCKFIRFLGKAPQTPSSGRIGNYVSASNEITVIPDLLDLIDVSGDTITIDAED
jgi:hypothetical protein